jgi:hypothetical protein
MIQKEKFAAFSEKLKKGVSVEEVQTFAHKYMAEVFIVLSIIIAMVSSGFRFFSGPGWALFFASVGAIVGISMNNCSCEMRIKLFKAIYRQEKAMQIIVGIIRLVVAIFLPFIIFAEIGLLAGGAFHHMTRDMCCGKKMMKGDDGKDKSIERDEEHI